MSQVHRHYCQNKKLHGEFCVKVKYVSNSNMHLADGLNTFRKGTLKLREKI